MISAIIIKKSTIKINDKVIITNVSKIVNQYPPFNKFTKPKTKQPKQHKNQTP